MVGKHDKENQEPEHFNAPLTAIEAVENSDEGRTVILVPIEGTMANDTTRLTAEERLDLEHLSPMLQEAKDLLVRLQAKLLLLELEDSDGEQIARVLAEVDAEDRKIQALVRHNDMGPTFRGVDTLKEFVDRIEARLTEIIRKQYGADPTVRVIL